MGKSYPAHLYEQRTSSFRTSRIATEVQDALCYKKARRSSMSQWQPTRRRLRVTGLFSGIGGIELGFARAGHECLAMCEIDPAAAAVASVRFPGISIENDVRTLSSLPSNTTLLAAGFPCQDLSQAGRTAGIKGPNSNLIMHIFRLLKRRRVSWVCLENVPFMLRLSKGHAMRVITDQLEKLGYMWAYRVVDTRAFGLPQRRERLFVVAALQDDPRTILLADDSGVEPVSRERSSEACGFYWTEGTRGLGWAVDAIPALKSGSGLGIPSPPAVWLPSGQFVTPHIRDAERLQGFPPGWSRPAEAVSGRGARWRLVGNAVSVPVARWIGERFARPQLPLAISGIPFRRDAAWPTCGWNLGDGPRKAILSSWPKRFKPKPLATFLRGPTKPLSCRATAGFFARARASSLHFPPRFLASVERHLRNVAD